MTTRYPQFCALARAAEVLGERWTLLIVRELLLGPKRFSDLRERLDGVGPSVLAKRLGHAEALGLVRRAVLPPPAASAVYELTEHGEALRPAVYELVRWGGRFLYPARRGERIEPDWMRLALSAIARRGGVPARSILLRIREGSKEAEVHLAGGPNGTTVTDQPAPAEATVVTDVKTLFALISGALDPAATARAGRIDVKGNRAALADLPRLFDVNRPKPVPERRGRGEVEQAVSSAAGRRRAKGAARARPKA